jgi:hypothetical protein
VIPFAATVLRSLALLRYRSRASSHNDLTPLQGYRGLLASVFDLPWLVDGSKSESEILGHLISRLDVTVNNPVKFLSFIEGNPGVPGDGVIVQDSGTVPFFDIEHRFSLKDVTMYLAGSVVR